MRHRGGGPSTGIEGVRRTVKTWTTAGLRALFALVIATILLANCSPDDVAQPTETPTATEATAEPESDTTSVEIDEVATPDETPTPGPQLSDADFASRLDVAAGAQIEDAQGNLLSVYGIAAWPTPFEQLPAGSRQAFPYFADVDALTNPDVALIAVDVGMCSAGIDATGFGTAEFFAHGSPDDVLSTDAIVNRGIVTRHPVLQPGFEFPGAAECVRGWLPMIWGGDEAPTTVRYVLTTRPSAGADIERHVYQWQIDAPIDAPVADVDRFGMTQTVTFNDGPLASTTVVVDGWAELVAAQSEVGDTRLIGVSLTYCPSSLQLPEFGLTVDGWSIIAVPEGSDLLGARRADDPTQQCFDGWLEFAVPFGAVPTAFFVSDGLNSTTGYAEWTLANAALPAPE